MDKVYFNVLLMEEKEEGKRNGRKGAAVKYGTEATPKQIADLACKNQKEKRKETRRKWAKT